MQGVGAPTTQARATPQRPKYDLNVEVRSDGSVRVIPPATKCSGRFKHITGKVKNSDVLIDSHGRILRDLRVSLTDRCNFRCLYCLPETEAAHNFYRGRWAAMPNSTPIVQQWVPKSHLLTFEEIERPSDRCGSGNTENQAYGGRTAAPQWCGNSGERDCGGAGDYGSGNDHERFSFRSKGNAAERSRASPVAASVWIHWIRQLSKK